MTRPSDRPDAVRPARATPPPPAHDGPQPAVVLADDLCIDLVRRHVARGGRELRLTPLEYHLLTLLAQQGGRVVTHHWLIDELWGPTTMTTVQTLHGLVSRLRRKVEPRPALPSYIVTVAHIGYRFAARSSEN